jgi:DNA-directed RNA polymerase specialized sigma24 family protein
MRTDQVQEMALVAQARRELLLRSYRHRLRKEDLEDCFGQATLELLAQARAGGAGTGAPGAHLTREHMANLLEQRFVSRIQDRVRALGGRSPAQAVLDHALPLSDAANGIEVADVRAEIERLVMLRSDLRSLGQVIGELTPDQRLVLVSLAGEEMECAEFCERHGWSKDKYRKVSQRARARLRELLEACEETFPRRMSRLGAAVGEGDRELL